MAWKSNPSQPSKVTESYGRLFDAYIELSAKPSVNHRLYHTASESQKRGNLVETTPLVYSSEQQRVLHSA
ncbi:hypothetical protein GW17_00051990 [Ensete ventricosum]|nr:hypothetical protein GW17_00051990 [Ensete ventricosum]